MAHAECIGCGQNNSLAEEMELIMSTQDPVPAPLSALDKSSFAYKTIKNRLPVIVGKTIDFIDGNKMDVCKFVTAAGMELSAEEVAEIIYEAGGLVDDLRELRKEIECNAQARPLERLSLGAELDHFNDDVAIWNATLEANRHEDGQLPRYFETSWLLGECYVYRRIKESLLKTKHLRNFDPFVGEKRNACASSLRQMIIVSNHLQEVDKYILESANLVHPNEKDEFSLFIQLALWANKSDLSLSGMSAAHVQSDELLSNIKESLKSLQVNILCNNLPKVWTKFQSIRSQLKQASTTSENKRVYIDLVADNCGYEIFADLCLVNFLTLMLCPKSPETCNVRFRFHLKRMPWFVSDTMRPDIDWLLKFMSEQNSTLAELANKWRYYMTSNFWEIHDDKFWTLPHDFSEMPRLAQNLYAMLQGSSLIIFKGDLNYRKLTGDRKWNVLTPFETALRAFKPAPLVALRTLKADIVVGIEDRVVYTKIQNKELPSDWQVSGEYGLIQYFEPKL